MRPLGVVIGEKVGARKIGWSGAESKEESLEVRRPWRRGWGCAHIEPAGWSEAQWRWRMQRDSCGVKPASPKLSKQLSFAPNAS